MLVRTIHDSIHGAWGLMVALSSERVTSYDLILYIQSVCVRASGRQHSSFLLVSSTKAFSSDAA
jgi:hypothetical protein